MFIGIHQKKRRGDRSFACPLFLVEKTDKQNEVYFRSNSLWGTSELRSANCEGSGQKLFRLILLNRLYQVRCTNSEPI